MTGAAEIVYNGGKVIPCVLDNRITGMTGHQENPGTGETLMGTPAPQIDIAKVLSALGFEQVFTVDPLDLSAVEGAMKAALASEKPAAIVAKSPCVLVKKLIQKRNPYAVDPAKCRSCKRCLKVGCPALSFDKTSSIDPAICVGCSICAQVCPFGAISQVEGA